MYLSFLLLPDEPHFSPLSASRVTDPLTLVTLFLVLDSVCGFMSKVRFGIQIPTPNYIINFMAWVESGYSCFTNSELKHKINSGFSRLCRSLWHSWKVSPQFTQASMFQKYSFFLPLPDHFLQSSVPVFSAFALKLCCQCQWISLGIKHC